MSVDTNTRLRFTTKEAADYASKHVETIRRALEAGELHGGQRKVGGRWSIRRECLDAYLDGDCCQHFVPQLAVAASRRMTP